MSAGDLIDLEVVRGASAQTDPYPFLIAKDFVKAPAVADVQQSFPDIDITGFRPASDMTLHGAFARLVDDLGGDEVAAAVGEKLDLPLAELPRFITIRKLSATHEGRIHCDSESKVASMLLYLNDGWSSPDGRLRVLRGSESLDDYAAEIDPLSGTIFGFQRCDNSWHGHTPFAGERRVIQVAWLRSQEDAERKIKNHRVTGFLRRLLDR
jgi:hypothetical protein